MEVGLELEVELEVELEECGVELEVEELEYWSGGVWSLVEEEEKEEEEKEERRRRRTDFEVKFNNPNRTGEIN